MVRKIIAQGAEAMISLNEGKILKDRISKGYRLKELDEKLRRGRTKREARLLEKVGGIEGVNVPGVLNSGKFDMIIDFIDGDKLSEKLDSYSSGVQEKIFKEIGEQIKKLHCADIIHGDLTTSNIIYFNGDIFLIDFGLGFVSSRLEDKAVDIHLLKQALEAKHFKNWKGLFEVFLKSYDSWDVIEQMKKVEARGRYKN